MAGKKQCAKIEKQFNHDKNSLPSSTTDIKIIVITIVLSEHYRVCEATCHDITLSLRRVMLNVTDKNTQELYIH